MKKGLSILLGTVLGVNLLINVSYGIVIDYKHRKVYANVYNIDKQLQITKGTTNNYYLTNLINEDDIINYLEQTNNKVWKIFISKIKASKELGKLNNLLERNYFVLDKNKITPNDISLYANHIITQYMYENKTSLHPLKKFFKEGENYIFECITKNLTSIPMNIREIKHKAFLPFFCSKPVKIYYINGKILLSKDEYEKIKNLSKNTKNETQQMKYNYIIKILVRNQIDGYIDMIENYIKNYVKQYYNDNIDKKRFMNKIYFNILKNKNLYIYNKKNIFWYLSKQDIKFLVEYLTNKYIEEFKKEKEEKIKQQLKYKQEALNNYSRLKQDYNKCLMDKEKIIKKLEKDRQKAIQFTKKLTTFIKNIKGKENKLKALNKVEEILNTKYGPDKFKNQQLIGFVKDYIKIIKLAISLY